MQNQRIKIEQLSPNASDFELHFEILELTGDPLTFRIVDDTGIIDAYFDQFASRLSNKGVFSMSHLRCTVHNSRLRVQMSAQTEVSKEPGIIAFKDKSNDISMKKFSDQVDKSKLSKKDVENSTESTPNKLNDKLNEGISKKKQQTLIPFTKQQAIEQLKLQKQFELKLKGKKIDSTDKKQKPYQEGSNKKDNTPIYKPKEEVQKLKTPTKDLKQNPTKIQYREKEDEHEGRITKAKSTMYKPKVEQFDNEKKIYKQKYEQKQNRNQYENTGDKQKWQHRQKQIKKTKDNSSTNKKDKPKTSSNGQSGKKQQSQSIEQNMQRKNNGIVEVIKVLDQVGKHVHVQAWITDKQRKVSNSQETEHLIADKTGSVWLRILKLRLRNKITYQFENLQVFRDDGIIYLKESDLSEAKQIEDLKNFNMREINSKQ